MNEQSVIISAFELLCGEGKPAALATVVSVSGSAYRRPGARMLIAEDGRTWGGISGGCLERDVVRRSRGVLASGRPVVCRYETTDDEDLATGVATGCRGTVELFLEPLSREAPGPVPWLIQASRERRAVLLATIVRMSVASVGDRPGARLSLDERGDVSGQLADSALRGSCLDALSDAAGKLPKLVEFHSDGVNADVFIERLLPPQELVIFGAGPDAVPVVSIAKLMGWRVSVVGVRPASGLPQRFVHADVLHVTPPEDPLAGVEITPDSAVVLMTHNYPRDIGILAGLSVAPRYLGILGPRIRTEQLFAEINCLSRAPLGAMGKRTRLPVELPADLKQHGHASTLAFATHSAAWRNSVGASESTRGMTLVAQIVPPVPSPAVTGGATAGEGTGGTAGPTENGHTPHSENSSSPAWQDAFAPVGLDLGAETPEEIALSIIAEIQAVLRSTSAGFLSQRDGPIHALPDDEQARPELQRVWREVSCPT